MKLRNFTAAFLAVACLFTTVSADTFWEESKTKQVTQDVYHTYTARFHDKGWQRTNVLEINLENENLDLVTMFAEGGISKLESLPKMAEREGVVAAVNGDFFNWEGTPLGFTAENGEVISSPAHDTGLAALLEDENGFVFTEYVDMHLFVTSPEGYKAEIIHINKYHSMESMVLYTEKWGKKTPGSYDGISELLVVDGKVQEIRRDMEGVKVPQNGYVLATSTHISTYLVDNFKVGDQVELSMRFEPDFGNIKTAIGGGTVLVKEGKRATFTNNVSGSHPRTAAGVDKSGKKLFLVTVDGRQTATAGMTQTELADYMISLGAYEAINFDGGGSTTMVVREGETNKLGVVNTPSDGKPRAVSTGLGVRYTGQVGAFSILEVHMAGKTVTEGGMAHLYLGAYDEKYNPVYIADREIQYTSEDGTFQGNIFYPAHAGKCTVTATCGNVSGTLVIDVLKAPTPFAKKAEKDAVTLLLLPEGPRAINCLDLLTQKRLAEMEKAESGMVYRMGKIEGYRENLQGDTLFLTIDAEKGGIRQTDAAQWKAMMEICENSTAKNVVCVLSDALHTFQDSAEAELLHRVLTEKLHRRGADVFLIQPGAESKITEKDGIRYIEIAASAKFKTSNFFEDCERLRGIRLHMGADTIYAEDVPLWGTVATS